MKTTVEIPYKEDECHAKYKEMIAKNGVGNGIDILINNKKFIVSIDSIEYLLKIMKIAKGLE